MDEADATTTKMNEAISLIASYKLEGDHHNTSNLGWTIQVSNENEIKWSMLEIHWWKIDNDWKHLKINGIWLTIKHKPQPKA